MKIKNIVASLLQVLLVPAASASITLIPDDSPLRSQSMLFRVNYQEWNMPVGYQTMGVVTTEGLFEVTPNWYGGFGLGGAVKGGNGGFFMLNFTGGYQHKIVGPLWMDLAANIGAGGGHTTPVGGGLFYEPEATLSYHLKWVNLGLGYSYVKFPQGDIRSHQAVFTVDVPFGLNAASASVEGDPLITDDTPVHFGHNRLSLIGDLAFPRAGSKDTQGQPERGRVALMGVEFAHFLSETWFGFAEFVGAFRGQTNGFAAAMIGPGVSLPLAEHWNIEGKLGVGSAGGGGVQTGGGLVFEPMIGLNYLWDSPIAIGINGGYLWSAEGGYQAPVAEVSFQYHFKDATNAGSDGTDDGVPLAYQDWRIRALNETYFRPQNDSGSTNPTMQLIGLDFDYWVDTDWYLTGQTAFAYSGRQTGGYFSGLIGPGLQLPMTDKFAVFGEALVGTAGGAGLDIGSGAMYQPVIGLNYQWTPSFGAQLSTGRLIAFKGSFRSTTLSVGLTYRFSTAQED